MNVIYADHRAYVKEDLGASERHPFGGLLLSTGEAVGYDDPDLDVEPSDDAFQDAHTPLWTDTGVCAACGRQAAPAAL